MIFSGRQHYVVTVSATPRLVGLSVNLQMVEREWADFRDQQQVQFVYQKDPLYDHHLRRFFIMRHISGKLIVRPDSGNEVELVIEDDAPKELVDALDTYLNPLRDNHHWIVCPIECLSRQR